MKHVQALRRLVGVAVHLLHGLWIVRRTFSKLSPAQKEERVQAWALALLARLAIKLVVNGQPPQEGPVLLVANHISWLDIVVMHAARHCRFVSKADVHHWPVVGGLADAAGTLYIERESRRDAMRVVHHMAERLQAGDVLAVFPEGTTGDGARVMPFHANLIQAAIVARAPVQPVALHFADRMTGAMSFAPCYIGDDTLLRSVWRTLTTADLEAVVSFGMPQTAEGRDRRTWAADLRTAVVDLRADPRLRV
ncbi:MAG: 1-acyl-sn-glycerol-3-phosphate acyltransferase [Burkholderiales bacterium]|nr:1-acyl-sn-glycerol-3-phosphate acyltransferase [Burkholderiales bacterium]